MRVNLHRLTKYHEAGHAVAAWALGVEIGRISAMPVYATGIVAFGHLELPHPNDDAPAATLRAYAITCYAGYEGARLVATSETEARRGCPSDDAKAAEVLDWINAEEHELRSESRAIIETHSDKVEILVTALGPPDFRIDGSELDRLLGTPPTVR